MNVLPIVACAVVVNQQTHKSATVKKVPQLQPLLAINFVLTSFSIRSSTLTGKYTHNHHTYENNVARGCNAPSWRERNEAKTMGAYMDKAGYNTGFFGKISRITGVISDRGFLQGTRSISMYSVYVICSIHVVSCTGRLKRMGWKCDSSFPVACLDLFVGQDSCHVCYCVICLYTVCMSSLCKCLPFVMYNTWLG